MLDTNTNKILWVAMAIGIIAILGTSVSVIFPNAMENVSSNITQMTNNLTSPASKLTFTKGEDIAGVSTVNVTDDSKIVSLDTDSKAIQIRNGDTSKNITDVWIKVEKTDIGTYAITSAGTNSDANNGADIKNGSIVIPNSIQNTPITRINQGVFQNATFKGSLTLPRDLQYIGEYAFQKSEFTGNLILPTEMWGIQNEAFLNSKFTGSLTLPKNISIIGSYTFKNSIFTGTLNLPSSISIINEGSFLNSEFSGNLILPANLTRISHYAFIKSQFTGDLIMPDSVQFFGGQIFSNSHFNGEFHISNNLQSMYVNSFSTDAGFNSNFNKVTGGKNLNELLKIKESSSDSESNLTNAHGIQVNGTEYKSINSIKSIISQ